MTTTHVTIPIAVELVPHLFPEWVANPASLAPDDFSTFISRNDSTHIESIKFLCRPMEPQDLANEGIPRMPDDDLLIEMKKMQKFMKWAARKELVKWPFLQNMLQTPPIYEAIK
ncbi:hypothetical protein BLNAU_18859 [Blattamonas nauphoetae]|uniref:Uncharacterized protein n=1 Tax=Blattamonas nauphoetae TaxID=2049346 RepID=A0ABQ9X3N0_9EUKA|nr:hypothetical protein BLNAU_18859 [Blattamonas nauphoetae]